MIGGRILDQKIRKNDMWRRGLKCHFRIDALCEWSQVTPTGAEAFGNLFYATYVHIFLYCLNVALRIGYSKMSEKVGC